MTFRPKPLFIIIVIVLAIIAICGVLFALLIAPHLNNIEGGCCTCLDCPECDVCCDCANPYLNKK